jgi:hypothetical protein
MRWGDEIKELTFILDFSKTQWANDGSSKLKDWPTNQDRINENRFHQVDEKLYSYSNMFADNNFDFIKYLDQGNENENWSASKTLPRHYHLLWDYQLFWVTVQQSLIESFTWISDTAG